MFNSDIWKVKSNKEAYAMRIFIRGRNNEP